MRSILEIFIGMNLVDLIEYKSCSAKKKVVLYRELELWNNVVGKP
jgi:hypothetical protein